ncbi:MAG: hypothetical protein PHQ46_14150, partial [Negativicutes bacterium]|nr:hypothetical protein [Negativicutes bacterium]
LRKYTGFTVDAMNLAKGVIASGIMGVSIYAMYQAAYGVMQNSGYAAIVAGLSGSFVYVVVLLLIGGLNARDVQRIPRIGGKLADQMRKAGLVKE